MHEGRAADNMRSGMRQWTEYLIKEELFPIVLVNLKKVAGADGELSILTYPTISHDRAKEYLEFLLANWDDLKPT